MNLNICDNIMFLKVFYFIRVLFDLVCFFVPIGLIIIISIDFGKNVIAGKEDEMRKNLNIVIKRLIYAVCLFLVPIVVEFAINGIGLFNVEYSECFDVTEEVIESKRLEQKAKCTGNKRWSDVTYQCEEKIVYDEYTSNKYNTIKKNFSSVSDDDTSSGNPNGGIGGKKELIYYNQGSYGNVKFCKTATLQNSGCGALSLAMMASTFVDKKYEPKYVGNWLCTEGGHSGGGMDRSLLTADKTLNHFNLNLEILFERDASLNQGNAGDDYDKKEGEKILKAVQEGKGIILYIPGHYLAVGPNEEKCDDDEVYLYDVGKRDNKGCYEPMTLWTKTYNYKNRCVEHGNCGWKAAYVYSKKK